MRVGIINSVALNGGDAAILSSEIAALSAHADVDACRVFDRDAKAVSRLYPDLDIRQSIAIPPSPRSLRSRATERLRWYAQRKSLGSAYQGVDGFVSTGGTYLVEHYDLTARWREFAVVLRSGRPLVLFTQSLGPFRRKNNRLRLRQVVDAAALVILRDHRSVEHLLDVIDAKSKIRLHADAAFGIDVRSTAPLDDLRVAISLREWPSASAVERRNYIAAIHETVTKLTRHEGASCLFISTCQGVPAYRFDDSALAWSIVHELPADVRRRCHVDGAYHTPEQLAAILGQCHLVIATRMHAGILALAAGSPVVAVSYEWKTEELFSQLGMADLVSQYGAPAGDLMDRVAYAVSRHNELRRAAETAVRPLRASAREASRVAADALKVRQS